MTADPSRSSSSASLLRIRAIVAASLAGLLFGFDTAVISGVTGALRQAYALSPGQLGLLVSTALWGTLAGALVSGRLGDRWGSLAIRAFAACCGAGSA